MPIPSVPDYYAILHVQPDAPVAVIRASYRAILQKLKQHPDLGGSHDTAAAINEAYAVLSNLGQRRAYDRVRHAQVLAGASSHPNQLASDQTSTNRSAATTRCLFCRATNGKGDNCTQCDSPLQPIVHLQGSSTDQRALQRLPRQEDVWLQSEWPATQFMGQCEDLTPRGMRLRVDRQLRVNSVIRIQGNICHAVARIAHASPKPGYWRYGVEFLTLQVTAPLGQFVTTHV